MNFEDSEDDTSSSIFNSKVIPDPFSSCHEEIFSLKQLLSGCYGPYSNLYLSQHTSGGHVSITSISSRLFQTLSVKNILLKPIITSTIAHLSKFNDSGLYCSLLSLCILDNSIKSSLSMCLIARIICIFGDLFVTFMESPENNCRVCIDLSNISDLQKIVRSILKAKTLCLLTQEEIDYVCTLLLKAFILLIPDDGKWLYFSNINYITSFGYCSTDSKLISGLLIKFPETCNSFLINKKQDVLVALFNVTLAGDAEFSTSCVVEQEVSVWNEVLEHLKSIADKLICDGVDVVFCQKVVHPSIRKQLNDNGVFVVDRLGLDVAENVKTISGAVPVLSLLDSTSITYGILTAIETVELGSHKYLVIKNEERPFCSFFITSYNEEAAEEIKVTCKQVIDTLWRIVKNPVACCGAGCTEIQTAYLLQKEVMSNLEKYAHDCKTTTTHVLEALRIFLRSIHNVILYLNKGTGINFATENVHHHLWKVQNEFPAADDKCQCGMFFGCSVNSKQWSFINESVTISSNDHSEGLLTLSNVPDVVDELSSKVHAATTAFKTVTSLMQVGLCIIAQR